MPSSVFNIRVGNPANDGEKLGNKTFERMPFDNAEPHKCITILKFK